MIALQIMMAQREEEDQKMIMTEEIITAKPVESAISHIQHFIPISKISMSQ